MEVSDVQGQSDAAVLEHDRGPHSQGPDAGGLARSGLRADEHGGRGDPRGRFDGLEFRDERRTALVIASGPSALGQLRSCESWRAYPAVCVNDSWRLNPSAAAVYAADRDWWTQRDPCGLRYIDLCRQFFRGSLWTSDPHAAKEHGFNHVALERAEGLSRKEGVIRTGGQVGNSGAQLINLVTLWGAQRLLLVGFDMRRGEVDGKENQAHWFGDHPKPLKNDSSFARFVTGMGPMAADLHAAGIEVINCSPGSALPYWPRRPLAGAIG